MPLHRSRVVCTVRPPTSAQRLVPLAHCKVTMSNETRPSQGASTRKHDVDALLADLSLDVKPPHVSRKPSARPFEHKSASTRPDDAQSLLDDLEGLVQRRRSLQRDAKEGDVSPNKQASATSHTASPGSRPGLDPVRPMQRTSPSPSKAPAPCLLYTSPSPRDS